MLGSFTVEIRPGRPPAFSIASCKKKDYKGLDFTFIKQDGDLANDDIDAYG
ncbi:MAG: hypothetical protein KAI50_13215 [Desulfobacterales bacterium]|nr:hypothetical protein [Desulfobacterales bacterium]